jgi:hypothetical protein
VEKGEKIYTIKITQIRYLIIKVENCMDGGQGAGVIPIRYEVEHRNERTRPGFDGRTVMD